MNPHDPIKRTGADTSIDAPYTPGSLSSLYLHAYFLASCAQQGSRLHLNLISGIIKLFFADSPCFPLDASLRFALISQAPKLMFLIHPKRLKSLSLVKTEPLPRAGLHAPPGQKTTMNGAAGCALPSPGLLVQPSFWPPPPL